MKWWRLLLSVACLTVILCLISSQLARINAAGDKTKTPEGKTSEPKTSEPKTTPATTPPKTTPEPTKSPDPKTTEPSKTTEPKKTDEPKEVKKEDKLPEGEKLVWKAFDGKEAFFQKIETVTTQKLKVIDQEIKQEQKQIFYVSWTPKEKKGDNWVVVQKILGMEMDIDIGGNKIQYKSTADKIPSNPMSDFFNSLKNAELTYHIKPDLTIEKVEGRDSLIEKLSATNPQMKTLLMTLLSDEALKKMAEPTWGAFPTGGTAKAWTKKVPLTLGNIGTYESNLEYTLGARNKETGITEVSIKSGLEYTAPAKDAKNPRLPFTIKEAKNTKTGTGSGTAKFDEKKGRFSEVKMKTEIKDLELLIEVGSVDTRVTINQEQNSIVTTSDTDFLKK